ncbi:MAG: YbgC/FadM family acyl-CoA thioesterase [Gammaproteobacteria bacterium]|nr:YbgC/FadM family acyl-CoA thioesterase [Gammaproteobacteria bacterium]
MNEYPVSTIKLKVYLEDTDAGGVVYHANYLKYMERARTDFIGHHGLERNYMLEGNKLFLVRKMDLSFHSPAFLDDELEADAAVETIHKYAATFKQQVIRPSDSKLLCSAYSQVVCVERVSKKLLPIPFYVAS